MIRWQSVISKIYDVIFEYRDREVCTTTIGPEPYLYIHNIHGRYGDYNQLSFISLSSRSSFGRVPFLHGMEVGPLGAVPRFTKATVLPGI